jgi:drug/metabolite transporter superfamily protein YnfA
VRRSLVTLVVAFVLAIALAHPGVAHAQAEPSRWVLSTDLGAGIAAWGARHGHAEIELSGGYDLFPWLRPEASLVLGVAPGTYAGLRLGVHTAIADTPFYGRAALDLSSAVSAFSLHWFLAGAGLEARLTDVLGGFVEGDVGIPLESGAGLPMLLRAGVTIRL